MGRADVYSQPHAPDPVLTDELVLGLTRQHMSEVDSVTGVDESGGEARAYLVDDTIVVKTQRPHRLRPRTSLAKEAYLLEALAPVLGARIPRLLGYGKLDTGQGPVEYICMSRVPGHAARHATLDAAARQALISELGRLLRRLHAASVGTNRLPTDSDATALRRRLEHGFADIADSFAAQHFSLVLLPLALDRIISRSLAALPQTLTQAPMPLHSNPSATHVFVDPGTGRLTGLIDFGDSYAGHPALDLHRWPNPADRIILRHGYLGGTVPTAEFEQVWTIAMIAADLTAIARGSLHTDAAIADLAVRLEDV
ncbi:MAG TPA: aminoglycoside phosphotransferase family protein [Candidatus Limnocylindrales bacterium]|nr:aminoglycoside phosphotransferase family protein [Candidatus Limnocylindrales bacterium]